MFRPSALVALILLLAPERVPADMFHLTFWKLLQVQHRVTTDQDYAQWEFFVCFGDENPKVLSKKLSPDAPLELIERLAEVRDYVLVAVPKSSRQNYKTEADFLAAVSRYQVEGQLQAREKFFSHLGVSPSNPRKSFAREHRILRITPEEGIVLETVDLQPGEFSRRSVARLEPVHTPSPQPTIPDDEATGTIELGPPRRTWFWPVALGVATLLILTGLWLAPRLRRALR